MKNILDHFVANKFQWKIKILFLQKVRISDLGENREFGLIKQNITF